MKAVTNVSQFPGLNDKLLVLNLADVAFLPKENFCKFL